MIIIEKSKIPIKKDNIKESKNNDDKNNKIKENNINKGKKKLIKIKKENDELQKDFNEKNVIFEKQEKELKIKLKDIDEIEKALEEKYKKDYMMKLKELDKSLNNKIKNISEELEKVKNELKEKREKEEMNKIENGKKDKIEKEKLEKEKLEREKKGERKKIEKEKQEIQNPEHDNIEIEKKKEQKENEKFASNIFNDIKNSINEFSIFNNNNNNENDNLPDKKKNKHKYMKKELTDTPKFSKATLKKLGDSESNLDSSVDENPSKNDFYDSQRINHFSKEDLNTYSFECINFVNLSSYIYEGTEETDIKLRIKNNGNKDWPEKKVKLKFEIRSNIIGEGLTLKAQKCGEEITYQVKFKNLKSYQVGEYKSYITFNINGKKIGEELSLRIIIKKKENPDDKIKQNMEEIMNFRGQFGLSEEEFPNKKVFDLLKANNFDFEMAFSSLFNN